MIPPDKFLALNKSFDSKLVRRLGKDLGSGPDDESSGDFLGDVEFSSGDVSSGNTNYNQDLASGFVSGNSYWEDNQTGSGDVSSGFVEEDSNDVKGDKEPGSGDTNNNNQAGSGDASSGDFLGEAGLGSGFVSDNSSYWEDNQAGSGDVSSGDFLGNAELGSGNSTLNSSSPLLPPSAPVTTNPLAPALPIPLVPLLSPPIAPSLPNLLAPSSPPPLSPPLYSPLWLLVNATNYSANETSVNTSSVTSLEKDANQEKGFSSQTIIWMTIGGLSATVIMALIVYKILSTIRKAPIIEIKRGENSIEIGHARIEGSNEPTDQKKTGLGDETLHTTAESNNSGIARSSQNSDLINAGNTAEHSSEARNAALRWLAKEQRV